MFPQRTPENDQIVQSLTKDLVQGINDNALNSSSNFNDGFDTIPQYEELKENGLFLCGYMKCGTTLLLQLLDGHPELVVLPGDGWFMGRRYLDCDDAAVRYKKEFRDHWLARIINPTGQSPFWLFGEEVEDYSAFVNHYEEWFKLLDDKQRGHMMSTVLAYCSANPQKPAGPKLWVEKTPGNEFEIERILNFFPQARFLHIVRDPRENFASLKRLYQTRNWDWRQMSIAKKIGESCAKAVFNQKELGKDRYLVLQYEKLTEDPERTLKKIQNFLGIAWTDSLLIPTVNGRNAQANTMYGDRKIIGRVRKATKDKWKSVLSGSEKRAILNTLKNAEKAGYSWNVTSSDRFIHFIEALQFRLTAMRDR